MPTKWLYRDQKVAQQIIDQYEAGQTLTEPAFVDCSKLRGGMLDEVNLRYLILSNSGLDLGQLNTNAKKFGLVVLPRGKAWKVLDKHRIGDKTQVLMMPIGETEGRALEEVINAARRDFEDLYEAASATTLNTDEWKNRLFFPVGLTDEGVPYPQSS